MGGDADTLGEMVDHTIRIRAIYSQFADVSPGMVGWGGCESLRTHLKEERPIAER